MGFWQGFILFSLLAMFFVLWPTLVGFVRERKSPHQHSAAQDGARPEGQEELEKTRVMTESDTDKVESSAQNLAQTHRQDDTATLSSSEKAVWGGFRSRLPIIAIAVLMPFMAIFMYWQLGAKDDWKIHQLSTSYSNATTTEEAKEAASALVRALQARLISSP
jgi:cytochrome c-type biogenesis protein CcmH